MNDHEKAQMVERYQCPGCVLGSDTDCGKYVPIPEAGGACESHVLGTHIGLNNVVALGLPKGFCRPGVTWDRDGMRAQSRMEIRFSDAADEHFWDRWNVAVWAMEYEGDLLVRTYAPRTNRTTVDVVRGGKLTLVPGAVNVATFLDEMD